MTKLFYWSKMVSIMLKISHTKVKSTSKKLKGQWYPRMYIKSSNWDKEIKPRHREILFYYRADTEVKEKLQLLIDDLIASLDVNELDANQRIKMLQIALQYTLPRIKQATNEVSEDLPLFV